MRSKLLCAALLCAAALTGCDQWFTVDVDPDMQDKLHLASPTVTSDRYPALRQRYDAIKREEAATVEAKAKADAKAEADSAAKTAATEAEVVSKANREADERVDAAKRRHDRAVRDADTQLDDDLAKIGSVRAEVVTGAVFRSQQSLNDATSKIAGIKNDADAKVAKIYSTRDSVVAAGDLSFGNAKDRQAGAQEFAQGAGGILLPALAATGGLGTVGASLIALMMKRKSDQTTGALRSVMSAAKAADVLPQLDKHLPSILENHEAPVLAQIRAADAIDMQPRSVA